MVSANNISFKVGNKILLDNTDISFEPGLFHVIMGSNGAGKSTLLKLLAGELKPTSGKVQFGNKQLDSISKPELAKKRAVLSQHYEIHFPIQVDDIVLMGRYPYYSNDPSKRDLDICKQAKVLMEVAEFGERDYNTLSGGESQKVQMSRVLAQIWDANPDNGKILFLDEPVSHLDIKYQYQLMRIAKELCKKNITVIAILHDINLAISFADRLLFMKKGKLFYDLNDVNSISTNILDEVFDVRSKMILVEGRAVVLF